MERILREQVAPCASQKDEPNPPRRPQTDIRWQVAGCMDSGMAGVSPLHLSGCTPSSLRIGSDADNPNSVLPSPSVVWTVRAALLLFSSLEEISSFTIPVMRHGERHGMCVTGCPQLYICTLSSGLLSRKKYNTSTDEKSRAPPLSNTRLFC